MMRKQQNGISQMQSKKLTMVDEIPLWVAGEGDGTAGKYGVEWNGSNGMAFHKCKAKTTMPSPSTAHCHMIK